MDQTCSPGLCRHKRRYARLPSLFAARGYASCVQILAVCSEWVLVVKSLIELHKDCRDKGRRRRYKTWRRWEVTGVKTRQSSIGQASLCEITAILELLKILDAHGAILTIDAMGCQKDIAQAIDDAGARYVLALKDNQATLHEEVRQLFLDGSGP